MKPTAAFKPVSHYIAHRKPMLLPDEILSAGPHKVCTLARVSHTNLFFDRDKNGVPAWLGLEYMAQTAGVWVGLDDERKARPIQLGFLLGSRAYRATTPLFTEGSELHIHIEANFIENNIVVFDGSIFDSERLLLAEGNLTAFRPDDVNAYLRSGG